MSLPATIPKTLNDVAISQDSPETPPAFIVTQDPDDNTNLTQKKKAVKKKKKPKKKKIPVKKVPRALAAPDVQQATNLAVPEGIKPSNPYHTNDFSHFQFHLTEPTLQSPPKLTPTPTPPPLPTLQKHIHPLPTNTIIITIDSSSDSEDEDVDKEDSSLSNSYSLHQNTNVTPTGDASLQIKEEHEVEKVEEAEEEAEEEMDELEYEMFAKYDQSPTTIHQTTATTLNTRLNNPNLTVMIPPPIATHLLSKTSALPIVAAAVVAATAAVAVAAAATTATSASATVTAVTATVNANNNINTNTQKNTNTPPFTPLQDDQPKVTNASLQGIDMIVFRGETRMEEHQLDLLKTVAGLPNSFHTDIVPHIPQELVPSVAIVRTQGREEFGIGPLINPVQDFITPLTRTLFGKVFENVGLTRIVDASMMVSKNHRGEACATNAPFHFVFIPLPAVNRKTSCVNNMGQHEFDDKGVYFHSFWKNHVEYRNTANLTSWLNLSVMVPECLLSDNQRIAHTEGLTNLALTGPMIGQEFMYMTLYGAYCHSFRYFMSSEVTIRARAYGFRPIFLMTNTLIQVSPSWGATNNTRLVSCDRGAISFLSMIGFWKQNSKDVDDVFLMAINVKGVPLTTRNLIH